MNDVFLVQDVQCAQDMSGHFPNFGFGQKAQSVFMFHDDFLSNNKITSRSPF